MHASSGHGPYRCQCGFWCGVVEPLFGVVAWTEATGIGLGLGGGVCAAWLAGEGIGVGEGDGGGCRI